MLRYISVRNFAIIENIEVDFEKGMTALTGETGAGKSLLIDAIGLLLGDRATSNIVRTNEDKAIVEGVFVYHNDRITKLLNDYELDASTNELIIRRQITPNNNNMIKLNGQTITLTQLKEITSLLADIHTQHDTHRLINPDTYLDIIDGFKQEETEQLLGQYHQDLKEYKKAKKEYDRLLRSKDEVTEKLDLMKFQQMELLNFNLNIDEETELKETVEKMKNFDRIYTTLSEAKELLNSSFAIDRIYDVSKQLSYIESYHDNYKTIKDRFESNYFELVDIFEELKNEVDSLDFNPRLLDQYETRLNDIEQLKRKYRKELPQLIDYLEQITKDIDNIDHFDDVIEEQKNVVKYTFNRVLDSAKLLRQLRKETSHYIEQELIAILYDLELKKAQFHIAFEDLLPKDYLDASLFLEQGIDHVDFLITTNVGEPLKSLSKSASGGEMSRIMLGLKNLLVSSLQLSLIIFDEIDSGVSGYIANQVAKKMVEISTKTQVICITHIPQVAAHSDHHLFISKQVVDGRTKASIAILKGEERVKEIASMISGDTVSEAAVLSARELLQ